MSGAIATTIAVGAGVTAAATVYSAVESKKSAKKAAAQQQAELDRQAVVREEQDQMVAEAQELADKSTTERRARLATGRKGLLYGGKETGVTDEETKSSTLG